MTSTIVWFRRDLRLTDNLSLSAAARTGQPIIPVYIIDPLDVGGASRWWLHHSLEALGSDIAGRGGRLIVLAGDPVDALRDLAKATGADTIVYTARYEPDAREQEQRLAAGLADSVAIQSLHGSCLNHPDAVRTQGDQPYKVFTPYWRNASARSEPARPQPVPPELVFSDSSVAGLPLATLELLPTAPDWADGLRRTWQPGEAAAQTRLDEIEAVATQYHARRDRPDLDLTSRLSPHLAFGEVSARQVWHALANVATQTADSQGPAALQRQLYWRDFSQYLLYHFPGLPHTPLRAEFERFPWRDDPEGLAAWQQGLTGYPIVDAGMRQLWQTGWMHNRVRMIVASFLVKDLMIPWQQGADWFLDTLVDADLANNSASWQWVAGCGTDAAPYFRIFNPVSQSRKFDPRGDYIRRYVPELAGFDAQDIHEPSAASALIQTASGAVIGTDYPAPIVDHAVARKTALADYKSLRSLRATSSP